MEPKLFHTFLYGTGAVVCVVYLIANPQADGWKKTGAVLMFFLLVILAAFTLADWTMHRVAVRRGEFSAAGTRGFAYASQSVKGLTSEQLAVVRHYQNLEFTGLLGSDMAVWSLQCVTDRVPLEFVIDFLGMSEQTPGYLWPVREHELVRTSEGSRWANSERLCTELSNALINVGWAEKASGPYSAKLLIPLGQVYERLGLED